MSSNPIILTGQTQRDYAKRQIDDAPDGWTVTLSSAREERTKAQNRTIHMWFGQIAVHFGDRSPLDVKDACNLQYGRPILARDDPDWDVVFGFIFRNLNYEKKVKAIRKLDIPFTRNMSVPQLTEYMDQMQSDYRSEGVYLTDPNLRKYEEAK